MASIIRLIIGVPVAAVITFLLFTLMQILIFEDETPLEQEREEIRITISDVAEDVTVRQRDLTLDDVQAAEPPPPPPTIPRQAADAPSEDMRTTMGALPDFDAPSLTGDQVNFDVSDRDAQPLVRIEPQYPPRAAERGVEGHCTVQFDVTPDGQPTNISILNCSSSLFQSATIRAVERWRYEPRVEGGTAVWRRGVQTRLDYRLEG
ncbi:energy transducer TonB [Alkalicaulis satelles]|uniref:Protein TonB n=1 Tax=Alkalicaulis satelles TaxID=2609175 RepID=A0A5M6ZFH8_9PROT|nr:energy transducer TonB [Alkalicaulis satelles]KAA5800991.1 energy transducer TonB [Alkalicaulis satelles]